MSEPTAPMTEENYPSVVPEEGLHVLHLFYRIDYTGWEMLSGEEKLEARTRLLALVMEVNEIERSQLLTFSMVTPKADIGFMLLTPDLQVANTIEKQLGIALGADILAPAYSYLSMTEKSEYTTSDADYSKSLEDEKDLAPESPEHSAAMEEFQARIAKYTQHRLYPVLPEWPVFCFYGMSKRRENKQNWYRLSHDERKKLMLGHARVGRTYSGKILQLISGSTGLDSMEWGVSLFAHSTFDIKAIVYEMRFDPVTVEFGEFGDFFIGLQLPMAEIFSRLRL